MIQPTNVLRRNTSILWAALALAAATIGCSQTSRTDLSGSIADNQIPDLAEVQTLDCLPGQFLAVTDEGGFACVSPEILDAPGAIWRAPAELFHNEHCAAVDDVMIECRDILPPEGLPVIVVARKPATTPLDAP